MATIDSTLNDFMKLDFNTREMVLEILQKRQIESRRNDMAKSAKKSLKAYQSGKLKVEDAEELIARLNSL